MIEQQLKELIIDRFGSISKFAENIDMPWTTLDGVLKRGVNKANITSLIKICNGLKIDCESLYYGCLLPKQDLLKSGTITEDEITKIKKYRTLDEHGKEMVNMVLDKEYERRETKEFRVLEPPLLIPYYGHIASAGTGQYVFDDIPPEMIEVEKNVDTMQADFAIGVNGNSMEPTYKDGDTLLVKKQPKINIGEIGIFMVNGEVFIKELGDGVLISHNKVYRNISIDDTTICIGKVLGKL